MRLVNKTTAQKLLISSLMMAPLACATTRPVPIELAEARRDYEFSASSEAATAAPAELHTAKQALERADKEFSDDPESGLVRTFGYVAQRKSALARAQARIRVAGEEKVKAEEEFKTSHERALANAHEELKRTRDELSRAQSEMKDALGQLKDLKSSQVKQDERGTVITLSGNVLFQQGKTALLPAARSGLNDLAQALIKGKAETIVIEGHTDSTGSKKRNAQVSQGRAESVLGYLASKGISASKMKAVGRGPEAPIAPNTTAEGRATNRRVEIVIQGKGQNQHKDMQAASEMHEGKASSEESSHQ